MKWWGLTIERSALKYSGVTQAPAVGQFNNTRGTLSDSLVKAWVGENEAVVEGRLTIERGCT